MSQKDWKLFAVVAGVVTALLARALLRPDLTLGNFGDVYAYHLPLQHAVAGSLTSGRLPFWNPYIFSGLPLLANSQSAVFYPAAVLFRVLPLACAFTLYAWLHLLLAALGAHLFMRRLRLEPAGAAIFSAAFALSPFLIYRIPQGIPTHLAALAFVPWCWLAMLSGRRGFLALAWSLQFLSGHPQFSMINAAGMGLFSAVWAARGRPEPLRACLLEGGMVVLLCLIQWAPTAEFLSLSNRASVPALFQAPYSMTGASFLTLLWPALFGDPVRGTFTSVPSVFFELKALYIGLLPLVLAGCGAVAAWRKGPGRDWAAFGFALAATGALLSFGSGILAGVPVVGLSRVPARYALLVLWGLLLAGAAGWRFAAAGRSAGTAARLRAGAFLFVLADLGLWGARFVYAEDPAPYLAPNPAMTRLLAGRAERFATGPDIANPNKAMLYRARNVNGYDAFYLDAYTRYGARAEGGPAGDPSRMYLRNTKSAEMRALGVSYYLTAEEREGDYEEISRGTRLYGVPGAFPFARVEPGGAAAQARSFEPGFWTAAGRADPGERRLVLSIPNYPGWSAYVDGRKTPTETFDGLFVSAALAREGGPFEARFLFRPTAWNFLSAATAASWLAFAGLAAWRRE